MGEELILVQRRWSLRTGGFPPPPSNPSCEGRGKRSELAGNAIQLVPHMPLLMGRQIPPDPVERDPRHEAREDVAEVRDGKHP